MEKAFHHFNELFAQLGLPSDEAGIRRFITRHRPLTPELRLADAPCWNETQARFLREAIAQDADWAELVDQLDLALRQT